MRIAHLISSAGWYGAENLLINLAASSRLLGHDAVAAVLCDARNPHVEVAEHAEARGVPSQVFHCRGRFDLHALGNIRSWLSGAGVDIVHSHGYKADFYAFGALRRSAIGWVSTCHTGTDQPQTGWLLNAYDVIDRWLLRRADRVVAVSPTIAEGLKRNGIRPERVSTIGNGLDIDRFRLPHRQYPGVADGIRVVGIVGRLVREKGPYVLLDAAARVIRQAPHTMFVFVGDGPERHDLEKAASELGLTGHVLFAGERSDMPEAYASFDVLALPSFNEGMPMVVLEALAAGLPVVASSVGAVPDVLRGAGCGLLCPPGDAVALANALLSVLGDQALARQFGSSGKDYSRKHHSADAMARQYVELYTDIGRSHE